MYVSLLFFYLRCQQTTKINWRSSERGQAAMPFGAYLENILWPIVRLILLPGFDPLSTTVQS